MRSFKVMLLGLVVVLVATVAAVAGEEGVSSGLKTSLYGFIKLDASYDTGNINAGDFARWVSPGELDNGLFYMHARQTRLGLKFVEPGTEGKTVSGKFEFDFYGGGADNKYLLMFRHAFMKIAWDSGVSILAGQTSDVISPLVPTTVNYSPAWWAGDVGYRRPQIRLGYAGGSGDTKVSLAVAATRPIGGESNGVPAGQGRLGLAFPLGEKSVALGVSGHYGLEGTTTDGTAADIESWSGNVDLVLPIGDKVVLKGEAYFGSNMDAYLGGIGQGINTLTTIEGTDTTHTDTEIESQGYWGALAIGPFDKWKFNIGGAMDDPADADLLSGARSRNVTVWGNFWYNITKKAIIAYELAWWETEYKDGAAWDSVRNQLSFMLKL